MVENVVIASEHLWHNVKDGAMFQLDFKDGATHDGATGYAVVAWSQTEKTKIMDGEAICPIGHCARAYMQQRSLHSRLEAE